MLFNFLRRLPEHFLKIGPKFTLTPSLPKILLSWKPTNISPTLIRNAGHYVPRTQYDTELPVFLTNPFKACIKNWELIPILIVTIFAMSLVVGQTMWAIFNKMDVVYSARNLNCISRTMDLRHPTIHKLVVINQRYDPWPEMADVLEAMKAAEEAREAKAKLCGVERA